MKKFLSLVMALAMTLTLVTVGASAKDFTDKSSISYKEAVDVISSLGVVDGYTDGSYNPTATLTRGAAAKIICNLMLGPTTAAALGVTSAPFSDVPVSNVFAGYIAYCSAQGIINGYSDGTFKPAATVTGYQFMKMLLGALGYDGSIEGFTGTNWTVNVAKLAVSIGLDDGNDSFVGSKAMTREEAALYAFNTIKATTVEYSSKGTTIVVGGTTISTGSTTAAKVATTTDTKTIKNDGYVQFGEAHFSKLVKSTTTSSDAFGRPATQWTYKGQSIGTYADSSNLIASYTTSVTRGTLYDLVGKSVYNSLVSNAAATTNYDSTSFTTTVYTDGATTFATDNSADQSTTLKTYFASSDSTTAVGGKGALTEVYMDDNDNVTIVTINTYLVKASADYSASKETLSVATVSGSPISLNTSSKTLSIDDFAVSGYSAGDYILVTASKDTSASTYTIQSVAPATAVSGSVTSYTNGKYVTVAGTQYAYSTKADSSSVGTTYTVGNDATVYLDSYGYVIYVDTTNASSSYVFLTGVATSGNFSTTYVGAIITPDGTYSEVTLKNIDGDTTPSTTMSTATVADTSTRAGVYTYSVNSDGKYILTSPAAAYNTGYVSVTATGATTAITTNGKVLAFSSATGFDTVKSTGSTVFVVRKSDNTIATYTGIANVPSITTSTSGTVNVSYVTDKSGYATYVLIDCHQDSGATVNATTSASDYIFVLNPYDMTTSVDSNKNTYYTYKVIKDGEETTVNANSSLFGNSNMDTTKGFNLYSVTSYDSNGYINSVSKVSSTGSGYYVGSMSGTDKISYSSGVLSLGTNNLVLGSDVAIYLVDTSSATKSDAGADYAVSSVTGSELANDFSGLSVTASYAYEGVSSSDATVVNLFIYVSSAT